eukprot:jgi/Psemu1/181713/e_gw1.22.239.1
MRPLILASWSPFRLKRLRATASPLFLAVETSDRDSTWRDRRLHSSAAHPADDETSKYYGTGYGDEFHDEVQRLKHLRNVGILAHVDAGKTTVTERMLELAGVVRSAGSVDDGNTVTDFLPAERERGITIQSAAISFEWGWHNNQKETSSGDEVAGDDFKQNDNVSIQIIDTPGHVDFSVEVNRSVAVLDGAVLVVDAVAGVQAQTETVWRAITRPSLNNHVVQNDSSPTDSGSAQNGAHDQLNHEPLPCLALVNKMDKEGCHFGKAIQSLREKLPGANPIPIQIPLFSVGNSRPNNDVIMSLGINDRLPPSIVAVSPDESNTVTGEFLGVVDIIHMRAIVWQDNDHVIDVENCAPAVVNLLKPGSLDPAHEGCQVTQQAINSRFEFIEALAEVDATTEEYYLNEEEPSNAELRAALRRATIERKAVPVMAGAALKGKGLEPLLDTIADFLPSPLDRSPPALHSLDKHGHKGELINVQPADGKPMGIPCGHPLHKSSLALAFKVVHMKGRGSGDGRVVFARVYSGKLRDREQLQIITPPAPGELAAKLRVERIGGMLELAGGRVDNVEGGEIGSGEVCALVGLKTVVTGDTLILASDISSGQKQKKGDKNNAHKMVCLAGVASPKPVITVRLESETSQEQARLSEALTLMSTEDPSLLVEETESATLLSGLGELHIEVTLDRLQREFGLQVMVAAVHLVIKPNHRSEAEHGDNSCMMLTDPVVTVGSKAREYLGLNPDLSEEELLARSNIARALIQGCQGALKRGVVKGVEMTNVVCHVEDVDAEGGLAALTALPGALQAASANAVAVCLKQNENDCSVLEPTVSVEIIVPSDMVGTVLSDLSNRRGIVGDVVVGDETYSKSLVRGNVPLVEILGYANSLRSITGGEGAFTSEYRGHSYC